MVAKIGFARAESVPEKVVLFVFAILDLGTFSVIATQRVSLPGVP